MLPSESFFRVGLRVMRGFLTGVSIEETVRAIEEADKFPVAQMLEVC